MIEFKADCGHTVRAKDEDSGKVVRCAYCGREAQVPIDEQDELDFLFSEVGDAAAETGGKSSKKKGRAAKAGMPFPSARRSDPFDIVKKMAYVAAILICGIFVGKKYAWPAIQDAFLTDGPATTPPEQIAHTPTPKPRQTTPSLSPSNRDGFTLKSLAGSGQQGVYVLPVPNDVKVYYCRGQKPNGEYEWLRTGGAQMISTHTDVMLGNLSRSQDPGLGLFTFVVTIPVNSPEFWDEKKYPKFMNLRREIEDGKNSRISRIVEEYFRPDGAVETAVLDWNPFHIARRYEIEINVDQWVVLSPQFIPYTGDLHTTALFLSSYDKAFRFDRKFVEKELEFYKVGDANARGFLMDILEKLGTVAYPFERDAKGDGDFRVLRIDPVSGNFSRSRRLEGVTRDPKGRE